MLYAFISMFFAGFTSVIAKMGLNGISGELGLTIRTLFVCAFVLLFAVWAVPVQQLAEVSQRNLLWLGLSGITTALSWIFYYKALKLGDVATVALIDKGSVVVAMLMAWLLLREVITLRMLAGAGLIVAGLLVIAKKP
ncbi:EamA family transporter [Stutzerimonas chloritidismutans]|uniref:EamA family transporter n=1 Tax=Stutzerimonas chloritidismutans TaxID=203192 RepID=UPI001FD76F26|nr:EamA family transporter [Stutzerimonas chloritidismutans]